MCGAAQAVGFLELSLRVDLIDETLVKLLPAFGRQFSGAVLGMETVSPKLGDLVTGPRILCSHTDPPPR
jgi:hypothetical protein